MHAKFQAWNQPETAAGFRCCTHEMPDKTVQPETLQSAGLLISDRITSDGFHAQTARQSYFCRPLKQLNSAQGFQDSRLRNLRHWSCSLHVQSAYLRMPAVSAQYLSCATYIPPAYSKCLQSVHSMTAGTSIQAHQEPEHQVYKFVAQSSCFCALLKKRQHTSGHDNNKFDKTAKIRSTTKIL